MSSKHPKPVEHSKRKRNMENHKPQKKRRSSSSEDENGEDPKAAIVLLAQGILESRTNYNDITKLIQMMKDHKDTEEGIFAAATLRSVFQKLLEQGSLVPREGLSEKKLVVVGWLKEQLSTFKDSLLEFLEDEDLDSETILMLCMELLEAEGKYMYDNDKYYFPMTFLEDIVSKILYSGDQDLRQAYAEEFVQKHDDVRYYTFKSIKNIIEKASKEDYPKLFKSTLGILSALEVVPESKGDLSDFYVSEPKTKQHDLFSVSKHKTMGQQAWLALMSTTETDKQREDILNYTDKVAAPWFVRPELLADFLTNSYNSGGSMSLLALSGIFYLIQNRNLDYPSFYQKLYSLLDVDLLHSTHRSQFFRLLDTFLASTHLPAALVASFIKRLARLALNGPPAGIVVVAPWIYNQFQRHKACTFMIHRVIRDPEMKQKIKEEGFEEPFDPEEADPIKTGAIDSCLWELMHLQDHWHPNVAAISKIISEQFTKSSYNMEDFLDHSYDSLLETDLARESKKTPEVEYQIPAKGFLTGGETPTMMNKLWDFSA